MPGKTSCRVPSTCWCSASSRQVSRFTATRLPNGFTQSLQTSCASRKDCYPALHRMDEAGWVSSEWGTSDNNRRARYYQITKSGRRQLATLEKNWAKHVEAVKRVLKLA